MNNKKTKDRILILKNNSLFLENIARRYVRFRFQISDWTGMIWHEILSQIQKYVIHTEIKLANSQNVKVFVWLDEGFKAFSLNFSLYDLWLGWRERWKLCDNRTWFWKRWRQNWKGKEVFYWSIGEGWTWKAKL